MKLIYIDESGNTGTRLDDKTQKHHLISGLIVDVEKIGIIENDVRLLGFKHFGEVSQNTDFEFHGYEIHKGKGRYFSKIKVDQRILIMKDLLSIIRTNNIQISYALIDKEKSKAKLHPHQLAFLFLVERIEDYLVKEDTHGLLIADENQDIEQRLIDDLERFKTMDTGFGYRRTKVNRIIDSIHFVKSHNNYLIQLADIVAFVILRGKRIHTELHEKYSCCGESIDWVSWVDKNATYSQKIDLENLSFLNKDNPFIFKEFP